MPEEYCAFDPLDEISINDGLSTSEMAKARAQNINNKKQLQLFTEVLNKK